MSIKNRIRKAFFLSRKQFERAHKAQQQRKREEPGKEATEKNSEVALSLNEYTINDAFAFDGEIRTLTMNEDDILVSYDVTALFTNVPLDETIKILR